MKYTLAQAHHQEPMRVVLPQKRLVLRRRHCSRQNRGFGMSDCSTMVAAARYLCDLTVRHSTSSSRRTGYLLCRSSQPSCRLCALFTRLKLVKKRTSGDIELAQAHREHNSLFSCNMLLALSLVALAVGGNSLSQQLRQSPSSPETITVYGLR